MPQAAPDDLTRAICASLKAAFETASSDAAPYRHWVLRGVFPESVAAALRTLPFNPPDLHGVSGKRELHNDQRRYFAGEVNSRHPVCGAVADAFQSAEVVSAVETHTGADLSGSYVRLEYAQDTTGFWLEPHTDLGVKLFTMLIYLSEGDEQINLGTDIYAAPDAWAKRYDFIDNTALVFVPGADTWHGLARREIAGVRRSVIMNYVTEDWRAREQLAYPQTPVRS